MLFRKSILFLLIGMTLSSCNNILNQSETPLALPLKNPVQQDTLNSASLDFEAVKISVFKPRCISCHQQYENYSGVIRELTAIETAIKSNRMPKSGGPLSDNQRSLLSNWIAKGAPEKEGDPSIPIQPVVLEPTWKSISENLIHPKCLVCHNPQGQAKFLD